jgi:galactose oxidase
VLVAGGGRPAAIGDVDHANADLFSPPYLFNANGFPAPRPQITSVPATISYGSRSPCRPTRRSPASRSSGSAR